MILQRENQGVNALILPPISWDSLFWLNSKRGQIVRDLVDVSHCWMLKYLCIHTNSYFTVAKPVISRDKLAFDICVVHYDDSFLFTVTSKPCCRRKDFFVYVAPMLTGKDALELILMEFQLCIL